MLRVTRKWGPRRRLDIRGSATSPEYTPELFVVQQTKAKEARTAGPEPRNIPPSIPYRIFPLGSTPLATFTLELFQGEMTRNVTVRLLSSEAFPYGAK